MLKASKSQFQSSAIIACKQTKTRVTRRQDIQRHGADRIMWERVKHLIAKNLHSTFGPQLTTARETVHATIRFALWTKRLEGNRDIMYPA